MKKGNYIYFLLILLIGYSCDERFDLDPEQSVLALAVDAKFTNEPTTHFVKLTTTKRVTAVDVPTVSNANVLLSDGTDILVLQESDTAKGLYQTPNDFYCVEGKTYTLTISDVDINEDGEMETYTASSIMLGDILVDSVTASWVSIEEFKRFGWGINTWAWDPPEENFYMFKAWKNDTLLSDTLFEIQITNDVFFNGEYTNGLETQFLRDNGDEIVYEGDTIALEFCHITPELYQYMSEAQGEARGSNPLFGGPPANVSTNMSKGAVGFFMVYARGVYHTVPDFDLKPSDN